MCNGHRRMTLDRKKDTQEKLSATVQADDHTEQVTINVCRQAVSGL